MFVFAIKTASTPNLEDKKASVENLTEWARVQSSLQSIISILDSFQYGIFFEFRGIGRRKDFRGTGDSAN